MKGPPLDSSGQDITWLSQLAPGSRKASSPRNLKPQNSNLYCCPTDDRGGRCHTADCDGRSSCLLQLPRKQKTEEDQEVKQQDCFRCKIMCRYCGKRRHYEDECHIKIRESEKHKKAEEERQKNAGEVTPRDEAVILEDRQIRVILVQDEGP